MTHDDVVWLAGLLEGEGYFGIQDTGKRGFGTATVKLNMTDRDVVERAASIMSSPSVYRMSHPSHPSWKDTYNCYAVGEQAVRIMQAVLPYMGERRTDKIHDVIDHMADKPEQYHKLTRSQVARILVSEERGVDLARELGVTTARISAIRHGK